MKIRVQKIITYDDLKRMTLAHKEIIEALRVENESLKNELSSIKAILKQNNLIQAE